MNFFFVFSDLKTAFKNKDFDKVHVLLYLYSNANYQQDKVYQGLKFGEVYFSYAVLEIACVISRSKASKIMKVLEDEGSIEWIYKAKAKNEKSKILLKKCTEYIEKKEEMQNGSWNGSQNGLSLENKGFEGDCRTVDETVHGTLSNIYISNYISNNIYSEIFEHWNAKNIIKHKKMNNDIMRSIDRALKEYSKEEILEAIDTYAAIVNDEDYFFSYKWSLKDFLSRKNGVSTFTTEGSNAVNYKKSKKAKKEQSRIVDF